MADFLFLLAKINLVMAGAILIVAPLRRPMRAAFHATVGYALWLLVPVAALASLLPPRVIAAPPVNMHIPVFTGHALPAQIPAAPFDFTLLLFAAWAAGASAMLLLLAWQQRQFHRAERLGAAGPAVTGLLKPRIVIPTGFAAQFSSEEQAAILAHEKAHLARQDARINAAVALLRCLCWFNPLVHVGALWLRKDQELACDAAAMRTVSRVDYANALLKSQMRAMALPLGCAWPGAEHPLTERVALLKRPPPAAMRKAAGIALVLSLSVAAGVGAWAAQPQQAGPKSFTGKFFYSERDGDKGPAYFLTLESLDGKSDSHFPGHVALHFPYGLAQADHASLDWAQNKSIVLTGNVTLANGLDGNGLSTLHGQTLVFDARTGMLTLDGKSMPSGMPKYVPCTTNCKHT